MVTDGGEPITLFFEQCLEFVLPERALQYQAPKHRVVTEAKCQVFSRGSADTLGSQYFVFHFEFLEPNRSFDLGIFAQQLFLVAQVDLILAILDYLHQIPVGCFALQTAFLPFGTKYRQPLADSLRSVAAGKPFPDAAFRVQAGNSETVKPLIQKNSAYQSGR